jgi:hypothetical protein
MVFGAGQAGPSPRTRPRAGRRSMLPPGHGFWWGQRASKIERQWAGVAEMLLFPIQSSNKPKDGWFRERRLPGLQVFIGITGKSYRLIRSRIRFPRRGGGPFPRKVAPESPQIGDYFPAKDTISPQLLWAGLWTTPGYHFPAANPNNQSQLEPVGTIDPQVGTKTPQGVAAGRFEFQKSRGLARRYR